MTSGIKVTDEAKRCLDSIKIRHHNDDPLERYKILFLKIQNDEIVVDLDNCIRVKDVQNVDVVDLLREKVKSYPCCYVVYDCCYVTKESEKNELVSIMWSNDNLAGVKMKMQYASSKDSLKRALAACGIKHEWQWNDLVDMKDESILDSLGKGLEILMLEGKARN